MTEDTPNISVIVAAYNEAPLIKKTIERIVATLSGRPDLSWDLICINDGSTDETGNLLDAVSKQDPRIQVIHHWRNFGQGRALRNGFERSRGKIVVTLDADLSYGPEYIWLLYDALHREKVEIVLASPYMEGGSVRNVPLYRHVLSRWGNRYLARMSHYKVSTITCVVRAYRREVLDSLYLTSDGMELQLEVLMKSAMMGYRVAEIPADLSWAKEKATEADFRRVSKMKILRTIKLYLQMGWLFRPAYVFLSAAILMILPGLYMAGWQAWNVLTAVSKHADAGEEIRWAISNGLKEVFTQYTYSFVVSGALIIIGLQLVLFALIFLQSKFYFDELYRVSQHVLQMQSEKRNVQDP